MARLFLALVPPPAALAPVAALPRRDAPGVRWVDPDTWHVTVRFLGECEVGDVEAALDGVRLPHVTPRLGPTVTLLGPRVLVVPVAGVGPLRTTVERATGAIGRPPADGSSVGHLTLARLRDGARPTLLGRSVTASFDGDAVHLVRSTTRPDGADHEIVRSWTTTR